MARNARIWRSPQRARESARWKQALGAALLVRGRGGVTPTQAGRTLLQHARTILAQAERLREDLGAYAGGLAGQVRVLSNTNALTEFLPETLSSFLAAHPNVSVDLEERLSDEIVGLIAEGVADIGIVAGTVDPGRLTTYPFRSDRFVLVVARDHALARRAKISFAETLDYDFVGLDRASALQRFLADKASRVGRPLRLRVQLRSFDAVCRLVERNVGVGIVPETTVRWAAKAMEIKAVAAHRPMGAARPVDLRARLQGAAALCAPAGGSHARGAAGDYVVVIPGRDEVAGPESINTRRATHNRSWLWIPGSSLRSAPE